jgi:hypothetical protein
VDGAEDQYIEVAGGGGERGHELPFSRNDVYDTDYEWDNETGIFSNINAIIKTDIESDVLESKFKKTYWYDSDPETNISLPIPLEPLPGGHNPDRAFQIMKFTAFDHLKVLTSIVPVLYPTLFYGLASHTYLTLEVVREPFDVTAIAPQTVFPVGQTSSQSFSLLGNYQELNTATKETSLVNTGVITRHDETQFSQVYGISLGVAVQQFNNPRSSESSTIHNLELKISDEIPDVITITAPP